MLTESKIFRNPSITFEISYYHLWIRKRKELY